MQKLDNLKIGSLYFVKKDKWLYDMPDPWKNHFIDNIPAKTPFLVLEPYYSDQFINDQYIKIVTAKGIVGYMFIQNTDRIFKQKTVT